MEREQVILLYCHTILCEKSFVISSIFNPFLINNFTTCSALYQMSRRIVNTPHQHHYSGYILIYYAFCSGVMKECEAPFSHSYVRLKNFINLRSLYVLTRCLLSAKVVELTFSQFNPTKMFCKLDTRPIILMLRLSEDLWMQSLSKTLKPLKRNEMYFQSIWSKISFIALYNFSYVCGLIHFKFPRHWHVFVKSVKVQSSHALSLSLSSMSIPSLNKHGRPHFLTIGSC